MARSELGVTISKSGVLMCVCSQQAVEREKGLRGVVERGEGRVERRWKEEERDGEGGGKKVGGGRRRWT